MKIRVFIIGICFANIISLITYAQDNVVSSDSKVSSDFLKASLKFMDGDYSGSIKLYKEVLEKDTLLNKNYWYVLIDNLGMAYGITGDLESADKIFNYGLSKDKTYPLFYFNLACVSAEKNDMTASMNYLEIAYKYKKNTLPGETLPDPATDDSFKRFMKNDKFVSRINELKQKK
jgi:tetratricopeptide (TPR) repeat protein